MGFARHGTEETASPLTEPATAVRHRILALTTVMAVLLYLDRACLSVVVPAMVLEHSISKVHGDIILGAFFFGYALAQVPAGWLGDWLGARVILTACVLAWSVCTALTGLVAGVTMLITVRVLCGVSQAGAYPIAARISSLWVPFTRRAFASSVITLGGRAGGALAPVATAFLIGRFAGWRPVLWFYALLGGVWAIFFWRAFRQSPAQHPACNAAEVDLIESSRPPESSSPHGAALNIPWGAACRSLSLWMQCLTQFAANIPWAFLITLLPRYLIEEYGVDMEEAGLLASVPLVAGTVGCILGGMVTDRLTRRLGLKWGRNLMGMTSKFFAAAGLVGALLARDPILATVALAFVSFAVDTGLGATWAYFQDAGGPYAGTLLGWANMFGNLGAFVSPLLLGWLAQDFNWPTALFVSASLYVLSGLCWFAMDARVPIVPPGENPSRSV